MADYKVKDISEAEFGRKEISLAETEMPGLMALRKEYKISGIENRIEQIIANLLDNSISFSSDNKKILVQIKKDNNQNILLKVVDEGQGFKEKDTDKIFKRFYSNRPEKFGEHSGLGLNIVKNLVDLHGGSVNASNNKDKNGARVDIYFPTIN